MPRRLPVALALPAALVVMALSAAPALADAAYPTTPVPPPKRSGQPPVSAPRGPQPLGHAVGDAGAGLAVLRLLPDSVTTKTILRGGGKQVPKQSQGELGFGLSSAQVNSEPFLNDEHSVAQSAPMGLAFQGGAPQLPGALTQTAPPDNPKPTVGGLDTPKNPVLNIGLLDGRAHARWSDKLGPCTGPTDASTSAANVDLLNVIPNLGSLGTATHLDRIFNLGKLSPAQRTALQASQGTLRKPLKLLGGLLSGKGTSTEGNTRSGSLLSLPNTLSSRSVVRLVDTPGSKHKAVQSVSTLQVASAALLAHTPMEIDLNVVSQPSLTVTSTGDPKTSSVHYTAPVIQVKQAGRTLFTLDAAHPTHNLPLALALPNLPLESGALRGLPIVGNLMSYLRPGTTQAQASSLTLPLGVLRLSIGQFKQSHESLTKGRNGAPFTGYQLGATTRMLDLQVLPTNLLAGANLPPALADVSLGEQVGRAYAPQDGVVCATAAAAPPPRQPATPPKPQGAPPLAYTAGAYHAVPLFWSGTGLLLAGAVLITASSRRRRTGR